MLLEVEKKLGELRAICQQFRVRRLEIFGSGSAGDAESECGDLDFLVDFEPMSPAEYADSYFGLLEALQATFRRPIDLVALTAIKNPYFIDGIESSRALLYAA
jgi:predicted nucleotidyltransferase